jgi:Fe2+ transport system protein FeoA
MFKKFCNLCKFVEKIYKMGFLEGSGVTVLYIGHTVPKG